MTRPFWRFANFKAHQQRFIKVSDANAGNGASDAIACVHSHSCDMGCPAHNSDNWRSGKTARTNRGATVADLKADADELSKLYAALNECERARLFVLLFGP